MLFLPYQYYLTVYPYTPSVSIIGNAHGVKEVCCIVGCNCWVMLLVT